MRAAVIWMVLLAAFAGCDKPKPSEAGDAAKPTVAVSILPQVYFAQRIGGRRVEVRVLVGPGFSPATYEPTPRQMAALSRAKLYFRAGVPFEKALVPKIAEMFPQLRIVDTPETIELHQAAGRAKHEDEHHHTGSMDPHTWLDPMLAKAQARAMAEALIQVDPSGQAEYEKNLAALHEDLDKVDAELAESLAGLKGRRIFVFHPAYGYFARRYGLEQVPVQIEGKEPAARQLAELIEHAKTLGVRVIFVQPQFSARTAKVVAEQIGGVVVPIDPLARDYLANLRAMATAIREGLDEQADRRRQQ